MKFAIIAAGEGSRLAAEGVTLPKPLVEIGGEAMIDRLIRIFMQNDAYEIVVICNDATAQVSQHLLQLQRDGLQGRPVPLRFVVKSTPSSMHSFYEISKYLNDGRFVLTTVDTIFREQEFADYVQHFRSCTADGLMGVTSFVDDEKPLWVGVTSQGEGAPMEITGFYDTDSPSTLHSPPSTLYVSAGIYGLGENAIFALHNCIARSEHRMRNFQRGMLRDGLRLQAFPFTKVFDIDHASDISKAETFLQHEQ